MARFSLLSSQFLSFGLLLLGLSSIYFFFLYPLLFHPLRRIPRAHWTVAYPGVGSLWILRVRYGGRNNATIYEAHQRHGDVVRLAYNELSVNCIKDGIHTVYGGGWEKTDWYARRSVNYGVINMFLCVHRTPHSQKKRVLSNIYSKSNLQASSQLRANTTYLLVNRLWPMIQAASESSQAIDVYDMNNSFNMDSISAYVFGISRSTNFMQNARERRQILDSFKRRHAFVKFIVEVPVGLQRWLKRLRLTTIPDMIAEANSVIEDWNSRMCASADRYLDRGREAEQRHIADEPTVYKQFKVGIQKMQNKDLMAGREILPHIADPQRYMNSNNGLELMTRDEIHSEMFDHLDAGFGTSGVTLTYLYWEVSRHPVMQERLYQEFSHLQPQMVWPVETAGQDVLLPDPKEIDALPYLHAVIMETLRLHTPLPGQEPRVSPYIKGGSMLGKFSGIPGGVKVSAMAYTLHRREDVFPDPENFDPDRWLTSDQEKLKEMQRWFWAFSSGGRMCIGSHFAIQSMKTQVIAIYRNWRTEIVDDSGIEKTDGYAMEPKGGKVMLRFVRR